MEREGVKGPCVVGHVEVQKSLGPQRCSADCQTALGSHYELPRAPGIYFFVAVQVLGHQAVSLQLDLQFAALYRREENWGKSK